MTSEEIQKKKTFILKQQAQLTVTVGKLSVKVDRTADRFSAHRVA